LGSLSESCLEPVILMSTPGYARSFLNFFWLILWFYVSILDTVVQCVLCKQRGRLFSKKQTSYSSGEFFMVSFAKQNCHNVVPKRQSKATTFTFCKKWDTGSTCVSYCTCFLSRRWCFVDFMKPQPRFCCCANIQLWATTCTTKITAGKQALMIRQVERYSQTRV